MCLYILDWNHWRYWSWWSSCAGKTSWKRSWHSIWQGDQFLYG